MFDSNKTTLNDFLKCLSKEKLGAATFEELLSIKDIKILSIATHDQYHYNQVVAGINSGKNIFVEKPLCQSWEELTHLHDMVIKRKVCLSSNLVLRSSILFQHIRKLISSGNLGDIYYFEGDYLYGRLNKILDGWRKNVNGYSVMQGGGIHMIDLMLEMTQNLPSTVYSIGNKIVTKGSKFNYNDFHSSLFKFKNGLIGKITANFGCMHPHQHVIKIFGTKGTFIYDDRGPRIFYEKRKYQRYKAVVSR